VRGLHNLLYAYSPSRKLIEYVPIVGRLSSYRRSFLQRYPGDDYVDVLGYEEYGGSLSNHRLAPVIRLAQERGKIAAITETGVEGVPDPKWWTGTFLEALQGPAGRMAAFALLWRNDWKRTKHHYAPFPGHASADDFIVMKQDGAVVFGDTMPPMYTP
jgi:mannan endo-1,4-beta-mannosidase